MIRIRAHHLLCIQGFQGHGYSSEFASHLGDVKRELYENDPKVAIITGIDDICTSCPNLSMGECKEFGREVISTDKKVLRTAGIENGAIMRFSECLTRVNGAFGTKEDVEKVCANCRWRDVCLFYSLRNP